MNDFLWVEKYRPRTIQETILPPKLKKDLQGIVDAGEFQHLMFTGTPGLGKTTAAKAICNELGLDYIVINGSSDRNIDTLRNKIKQFASTVSLGGGYKVVILDEADYLNPNSFQPALRNFMEEFADNCRFILTCNFRNRILAPLQSRCAVYEFNTSKKEMAALAGQFLKRAKVILDKENVSYNEKTIAELIIKHAPDWRRILNELQRTAAGGEINDTTITVTSTEYNSLFEYLKSKDFKKIRQWVANNVSSDTPAIIRGIYDHSFEYVKPSSLAQLILILADYQYKAAFVADQELNLIACMVEIMSSVEFI
jgi:DNA polymerase III delta prime subunit